jgi:hypothetical protein
LSPEQIEITILRQENKRLKTLLQAYGNLCEVCFSNSWEPTEEGEVCGQCTLYNALMIAKAEIKTLKEALNLKSQ